MVFSFFRKKRQPTALKAVFFDLDGTLLDVEMNDFIATYLEGLATHFTDVGLRYTVTTALREAMIALMAGNHGFDSNKELFFAVLRQRLGINPDLFFSRLEDYCADGLSGLRPLVRPLPLVRQILERCRLHDLTVVLATNPIFPRSIIDARLVWGGIAGFPFDLVTSFENTRSCKPDPRYYRDLLEAFDLAPEEVMMVGNDTENDLAAQSVGMKTFLLETCLVDRGRGLKPDFRGDHRELLRFLEGGLNIQAAKGEAFS